MQKSIGNNIYWTKETKEFPTRSEIIIWWPVGMFGMAHAMLTKIGISCQHEKNLVILPTFTGVLKHLRPPVLHAPNRSWITVASLRQDTSSPACYGLHCLCLILNLFTQFHNLLTPLGIWVSRLCSKWTKSKAFGLVYPQWDDFQCVCYWYFTFSAK